jgi:hypothetical protein
MQCWEILNIQPTTDVKAIRSAYAKLLRDNNPEDKPEAYQQIREAYDEALDYARYADEDERYETPPNIEFSQPVFTEQDISPQANTGSLDKTETNNIPDPWSVPKPELSPEQEMDRIMELYHEGMENEALQDFRSLLGENRFFSIDAKMALEHIVIDAFFASPVIPPALVQQANTYFGWNGGESVSYSQFNSGPMHYHLMTILEGAKIGDPYYLLKEIVFERFKDHSPNQQWHHWRYIAPVLFKPVDEKLMDNINRPPLTRKFFNEFLEFAEDYCDDLPLPPLHDSVLQWWRQNASTRTQRKQYNTVKYNPVQYSAQTDETNTAGEHYEKYRPTEYEEEKKSSGYGYFGIWFLILLVIKGIVLSVSGNSSYDNSHLNKDYSQILKQYEKHDTRKTDNKASEMRYLASLMRKKGCPNSSAKIDAGSSTLVATYKVVCNGKELTVMCLRSYDITDKKLSCIEVSSVRPK